MDEIVTCQRMGRSMIMATRLVEGCGQRPGLEQGMVGWAFCDSTVYFSPNFSVDLMITENVRSN